MNSTSTEPRTPARDQRPKRPAVDQEISYNNLSSGDEQEREHKRHKKTEPRTLKQRKEEGSHLHNASLLVSCISSATGLFFQQSL